MLVEDVKERAIWLLTYGLLAIIIVGGGLFMVPNFRDSEELKRTNAELQSRIDRTKREIAQLRENQRRFRTDADFVEMIARQNHRVFPGELVFLFNKD